MNGGKLIIIVGARAVRDGFRKLNRSDSTPIWLDNLQCTGTEESLIDCRHNGIGIHNCNHEEDSGIVCFQGIIMSVIRIDASGTCRVKSIFILDYAMYIMTVESVMETFLHQLMTAEMESGEVKMQTPGRAEMKTQTHNTAASAFLKALQQMENIAID